MSGESDLKTVLKDKMEHMMKVLDDYESGIGLSKHKPPGTEFELEEYLHYDRKVLEALSGSDAYAIAYRLAQYAFYFQREINLEQSRVAWAKTELESAVASDIGQYDQYMKHDIKVALIAKENNYVDVMQKIYRYAELRVSRLTYLASSIKNLSDTMIDIAKHKTYHKGNKNDE